MQNANPPQAWTPLLWVPPRGCPEAHPTPGSALVPSVHLTAALMLTPCTQVAAGRSCLFNSGLHCALQPSWSPMYWRAWLNPLPPTSCVPVHLSAILVSQLYMRDSNPHLMGWRGVKDSATQRGEHSARHLSKSLQSGFFF